MLSSNSQESLTHIGTSYQTCFRSSHGTGQHIPNTYWMLPYVMITFLIYLHVSPSSTISIGRKCFHYVHFFLWELRAREIISLGHGYIVSKSWELRFESLNTFSEDDTVISTLPPCQKPSH